MRSRLFWADRYWRHIVAAGRPILVGPWRSEVGFEVLYWLPWLAAWRARYQVPREQIIVITRGGAGVWYDAGQTVDLYEYVPLAQLRQAMLRDAAATGSIKQQTLTPWERKLLPLIAEGLGLRRYAVLHPSVLYRTLAPWWDGAQGLSATIRQLRFAPLPVPSPPLTLALPERFVAARFYARHTWPLSEPTQQYATALLDRIAGALPVVLLETGLHTDDHLDFPLPGVQALRLTGAVTPSTNLAVQSAVLAKATAFVGTYGGTMQLAVRLGKPSLGLYTTLEGTCYAHKVLTEWLAVQQGTPLCIGRPEDTRVIGDLLVPPARVTQ